MTNGSTIKWPKQNKNSLWYQNETNKQVKRLEVQFSIKDIWGRLQANVPSHY
jgi:hypothetical protein